MKVRSLSFIALCGLLAVSGVRAAEPSPAANDPATGLAKSRLAPPYSGTVGEVVKLAQSGVDESVVLAYVKNSPQAFNPGADEIIRLRDAGISSQVLTAMLQRGGELRQQAVAAAAAAPQPMPPMQPPSTAGYATEGAPQAYPTYSAPDESAPASTVYYLSSGYPTYSYPYSYSYYYPGYSYVYGGYYYPYYYYPYCYYPYYSRYCYPHSYAYNHNHNHNGWTGGWGWQHSTPNARFHPQTTVNSGFGMSRSGSTGAVRFGGGSGGMRMGGTSGVRMGSVPRSGGFSGGGTRIAQSGGRMGGFRR